MDFAFFDLNRVFLFFSSSSLMADCLTLSATRVRSSSIPPLYLFSCSSPSVSSWRRRLSERRQPTRGLRRAQHRRRVSTRYPLPFPSRCAKSCSPNPNVRYFGSNLTQLQVYTGSTPATRPGSCSNLRECFRWMSDHLIAPIVRHMLPFLKTIGYCRTTATTGYMLLFLSILY